MALRAGLRKSRKRNADKMTLPGFEVENESSKSDVTEECLFFDWRRRFSRTYNSLKSRENGK
jgi:hypothetical protein